MPILVKGGVINRDVGHFIGRNAHQVWLKLVIQAHRFRML
jgi:hypothetical protein